MFKRKLLAICLLFAVSATCGAQTVIRRDLTITGDTLFSGAVSSKIDTITSSATLDKHGTVLVDASSAAVTVNLPTISGNAGRIYAIKAINATNTVTIDPAGAETIAGSATKTLILNEVAVIQASSTGWVIVSDAGVSGGGGADGNIVQNGITATVADQLLTQDFNGSRQIWNSLKRLDINVGGTLTTDDINIISTNANGEIKILGDGDLYLEAERFAELRSNGIGGSTSVIADGSFVHLRAPYVEIDQLGTTTPGILRFLDNTGGQYVSVQSPGTLAGNLSLIWFATLPPATTTKMVTLDSGGQLAWQDIPAGGGGTNRKAGQDNLGALSGTQVVNFSTGTYDNKLMTVNGNLTLSFIFTTPGEYHLILAMDAGGGHTITLPTLSGTVAPINNDSDARNHIQLYYDGTTTYVY